MERVDINQLKKEQVRSYLWGKLLSLPGGGALPGLRTMMAECGAGRKALEKAIAEAEAGGLLRRKARSGFFRCDPLPDAKPDFLIYMGNASQLLAPVGPGGSPDFFPGIVLHLQETGRKEGLKSWFTTRFDELPRIAAPLFLLGVEDPALLRRAESEYPRTVAISGRPGKLWVKPVYEDATRAGLEYLASLGHKAVGYTYYRHPDPRVRDRHLFEYYRFMAEHGYKVEPSFLVAFPGDEEVESGIERMFRAPRPPSALFAQSIWLPTVYRILKKLKVNIPWQVSVLGLGTPVLGEKLSPSPSLVNESAALMAEKGWELMYNSTATEEVVTPPLQVLEGASCRSCCRK